MVVYELKDTGVLSQRKTPKPIRRDISPTVPIYESKAIGQLTNRQYPEGRKRQRREPVKLSPAGIRDVKRLAEQVNLHLEKRGAGIHLVLIQEGDGFVLDVYDCSNGHVCEVIHDMVVHVNELQSFFAKLQKESGIIFDQKF